SEEHTSELQSRFDLVCRLLLEKKNGKVTRPTADAQELARQVLLRTTASRLGAAEAIKQSEVARASGETARQARPVAHGDSQAAARQLLLGQRVASDASGLAARRTR